ncbi:hypothetical protein BWQ96_09564 [Gracilariopsis chorda]|uniref:Uncharacterized protein n=1 Tax=Gracilariopsis chorda TaxID=448386 RepID=A0A2V3IFA3_9FLOR|nr:hypothetical protein BWQ96_09564 [Gracilariopsis chorda]|eukprot:PXF40731.1 hypothetical protein BWQ96_09564 [Gracilariopsis chorda]
MLLAALQSVGIEIPCTVHGGPCQDCMRVIENCSSSGDVLQQWELMREIYSSSNCRPGKEILRQSSGSIIELRACWDCLTDPLAHVNEGSTKVKFKPFPSILERADCSFPGYDEPSVPCVYHQLSVPLRCIGEIPMLCLVRISEVVESSQLYPLTIQELSPSKYRVGIDIQDSFQGLGVFLSNPCYPRLRNIYFSDTVSDYTGDVRLVKISHKRQRTPEMYSLEEVASGKPFATDDGTLALARSIFFGASEINLNYAPIVVPKNRSTSAFEELPKDDGESISIEEDGDNQGDGGDDLQPVEVPWEHLLNTSSEESEHRQESDSQFKPEDVEIGE